MIERATAKILTSPRQHYNRNCNCIDSFQFTQTCQMVRERESNYDKSSQGSQFQMEQKQLGCLALTGG